MENVMFFRNPNKGARNETESKLILNKKVFGIYSLKSERDGDGANFGRNLNSKIVLMRHGQSVWNAENRFTGNENVPLSEKGKEESYLAFRKIADYFSGLGVKIDTIMTSPLDRAKQTVEVGALSQDEKPPVFESPALRARNYGELRGMEKGEAFAKYGQKINDWKEGLIVVPEFGESVENVVERTGNLYRQHLMYDIISGKNVLIVSHHNVLRRLVMHMEGIGMEEAAKIELGTAVPVVYGYKVFYEKGNLSVILASKEVLKDVPATVPVPYYLENYPFLGK